MTLKAAVRKSSWLPVPLTANLTELWHNRLGHLGANTLKQMITQTKGIVINKTITLKAKCKVYRVSSATRIISWKEQEESFLKMLFTAISVDLFIMDLAYNNNRYMALFIYRYLGFKVLMMLPSKIDFPPALQTFINQIHQSYNINI